MARSLACELGSKRIRVNSLSPGKQNMLIVPKPNAFIFSTVKKDIFTPSECLITPCRFVKVLSDLYRMTAAVIEKQPSLADKWAGSNPLGRLGRPDELRGVITWLASDSSTFCTGSELSPPYLC